MRSRLAVLRTWRSFFKPPWLRRAVLLLFCFCSCSHPSLRREFRRMVESNSRKSTIPYHLTVRKYRGQVEVSVFRFRLSVRLPRTSPESYGQALISFRSESVMEASVDLPPPKNNHRFRDHRLRQMLIAICRSGGGSGVRRKQRKQRKQRKYRRIPSSEVSKSSR